MKEAESGRKTEDCRVKITSPSPRRVSIISCLAIQERRKLNWLRQMTVTSMETAKQKQNRKNKYDATWMITSSMTLVLHPALNFEVSGALGYGRLSPVSHFRSPIAGVQCPLYLPKALALCRWETLQKGHQIALKGLSLWCCSHLYCGELYPPSRCAMAKCNLPKLQYTSL